MKPSILLFLSNGVAINAAMVCCVAWLYMQRWKQLPPRPPVASASIIALTLLMFALQITVPGVFGAMRLDVVALQDGAWWRLVTPLFVQSHGVFQFAINLMFLLVFLPMAERLYGVRVWLIYFGSGIVGQLLNSVWLPGGGGSSTAVFGLMGAILVYVVLRRRQAPPQYVWFALAGLGAGVAMCFNRDGHGPGMLTGALLPVLLGWTSDHRTSIDPAETSAGR